MSTYVLHSMVRHMLLVTMTSLDSGCTSMTTYCLTELSFSDMSQLSSVGS